MSGHRLSWSISIAAIGVWLMASSGAGVVAAPQTPVTVLNTNFEAGLAGWTVDPATGSPPCAWAVDATPTASAAPGSPPNSINFNNGTNFNSGLVTGGATSPVLNLAGATSATLAFVCMYQTETTSASSPWDQRRVQMSNTGFSGTPPFNTQLGGTGVSPCAAMLTWHTHTFSIPVAQLASGFQVRFFFNTGDAAINTGQGWFVDNVVVTATMPGPPPPPPGPPPAPPGAPPAAGAADDDDMSRYEEIKEEQCSASATRIDSILGFIGIAVLALAMLLRRGS